MPSCTVNLNLKDAGYENFASQKVSFRLLSAGAEGTGDYVVARSRTVVTTDESGNAAATLWVNGDSGIDSVYQVKFPDGERIDFIIPTGTTTIELADLIVNHQPLGADSQQSSVYAAAIQRANHTGFDDLTSDVTGILPVANGGTGSANAAGAKLNLSLGPSDDQAFGNLQLQGDLTVLGEDIKIGSNADQADRWNIRGNDTGDFVISYNGGPLFEFGTDGEFDFDGISIGPTQFSALSAITTQGINIINDSTAAEQRGTIGLDDNVASAPTNVTSTTYTVLSTDRYVLVYDGTAGAAVTVTLPAAATVGGGFEVDIKKLQSSFNVTVDGNGSETIDGALAAVLTNQYESIRLVSDGSNWHII